MTLHAGIAFSVRSSHKVCLNHLWIILVCTCMQVLHLSFGLHAKAHPNYILGISKQPYMWILYLKLPFVTHPRLLDGLKCESKRKTTQEQGLNARSLTRNTLKGRRAC